MSDEDSTSHEKPFSVEVAKQGRALCKKCKRKCVQGNLRIAKIIPNPLGSGKMKTWHHVNCIFEVFLKQRKTTKRIEDPRDIEGWELLDKNDKNHILKQIRECNEAFEAKSTKKPKRNLNKVKSQLNSSAVSEDSLSVSSDTIKEGVHRDNCFREFRTVVAKVSNISSSEKKTGIFRETFAKGSDQTGFKGDILLWCKLLLPRVMKRVFPLETMQLVKIFSKLFKVNEEIIKEDLIKTSDDVGLTIQNFYEKNEECKPAKKSTLTIHEVDEFLDSLTMIPKEDGQYKLFKTFIKRCTGNDLKVVVRLIKHDLRMNAGETHVFEGLHPKAYSIFQSCRDIKTVVDTCRAGLKQEKSVAVKSLKRSPKRRISTFEPKVRKAKITRCKEDKTDIKPKVEKIEIDDDKSIQEVEITKKRTFVPNYFQDFRLYLEDGVAKKHEEWIRYFLAYGGVVLNPHEHQEATHVLHLKDTVAEPIIQCAKNARHVIVEWIKDTVEKNSLQDYRPYTVRWDSNHSK